MRGGRPRTKIGTYGLVHVKCTGPKTHVASTRVRDYDGRLRRVTATGSSPSGARALLKERILERPSYGAGTQIDVASPFLDLADLWLEELAGRPIAERTKDGYRDTLRLHVGPALEHFTLGEITTGRVEWFLKSQRQRSASQARRARTLLNQLFGYALRHDALTRNPVEGTSPIPRASGAPQALSLEQIAAIRAAAARWRTEEGRLGPKPDGQVRDIIEVLLGTGMRPGEALGLRPCDVSETSTGMVIHVTGTVVERKGAKAYRQDHPKTAASKRHIPVPDFAALVLRQRLKGVSMTSERTIFANRTGGVLTPHNVRRTFRDFLQLAGLADSGISLRWYRRTAATVIARGMGTDAAAAFLGHTSTVITEGHYIEPDQAIDRSPTIHLDATLRAVEPDRRLLAGAASEEEESILDDLDMDDAEDDGDLAS